MGGERPRAATAGPTRPDRPHHPPFHHPRAPPTIPAPPSVIPAQAGTAAHPPLPPDPATLTPEQECHTMPLSPQQRHRPARHAANPSLANADQNLTKVDTRLTGVDTRLTKVDTVNPRPNPKPQQNTAKPQPPHHLDTSSVNLHCQPLRRTPNKPEQIRTNLNAAKRPDQIERPPESPPNTPKKKNPEHRRGPLAASHPCHGGGPDEGAAEVVDMPP